jgi:YHS domain-containing protein
MTDINTLASRIDAEFSAVEQKVKNLQTEQVQEHKQRQNRLEQLGRVFDELREIWGPRLDLLVKKFGDRVQTKPRVVPSTREVTFDFQSRLARVRLKCAAFTDRDIQKVILSYDLEIVPVLMRFTPHAEIEFPLNAVDKDAAARWIDDRIVDFVQTYLSMGENEIYLKDEMVEDPIARVSFPKVVAAATLEWGGKTFYFVSEETRQEFEKQQGITNTGRGERVERKGPGEGPGQDPAARAAAWSAQELPKMDEGLRHVDEAIHGADSKRQKVYPKAPDPDEEP